MRDSLVSVRIAAFAAAVMLAAQLGLQLHLSRVDSQTSDEGVHLTAGYTYWEWGNYSLNPEHPPLVKLLAGACVRALRPVLPPVQHPDRVAAFFYDSWRENRALAEAFLYESGNDADRLLFAARLPAIFLTTLLGVAIFLTAARFFGPTGGLISTAMYVLDPTIAAHGHLVTTDIAISLGGVLVLASAWRFAHAPGASSTILLGVALGVASLAKFTSVIFLPILAVVLVLLLGWPTFVRRLPGLVAAVLIAWTLVFAVYGFSMRLPPPVGSLADTLAPGNQLSPGVKNTLGSAYAAVRYLGIPRDYFKGLTMVIGHAAGGAESFLLGARSDTGWWYYFPVVFFAKTPLPALALLVLTIGVGAGRVREPTRWYWLVAACGYFLCAMTSRTDLGLRHLMPAMAFFFIWAGSLALEMRNRRWLPLVTACLMLWAAADFFVAYDQYLAYFNEVVGARGYRVATDSNLDWGQDLKRIRAYLDAHPEIEDPYVVYEWDGPSSLDYYGIRHRRTPSTFAGATGALIINASRLPNPRFAFLHGVPYAARITPSVFLYELNGGR